MKLDSFIIGTLIADAGDNSYGDEGVVIVSRQLPRIRRLEAFNSDLSLEGMGALTGLTKLSQLVLQDNKQATQWAAVGRLPHLRKLNACTRVLS